MGVAFICIKAEGNRGWSLSATNVKLVTSFQNVITSQLIKALENALDTFYSMASEVIFLLTAFILVFNMFRL